MVFGFGMKIQSILPFLIVTFRGTYSFNYYLSLGLDMVVNGSDMILSTSINTIGYRSKHLESNSDNAMNINFV